MAWVAVATSCRQDAGDGDTKTAPAAPVAGPTSPAPAAAPAPAASAESDIATAQPSTNVSGSFLVQCTADTEGSFSRKIANEDLTACVVLDENGEIVAVKTAAAAIVRTDGTRFEPTAVTKEVTTMPWQIGVVVPADVRASFASLELRFTSEDGVERVANTDNTCFPWRDHKVMGGIWADFARILAVASNHEPMAFDAGGLIAKAVESGKPYHFLIATDRRFPANFGGLAAADAACAEAGAKVDAGRTWVALLSDSKTDAKSRIELRGMIFSFVGYLVGDVDFWTSTPLGPVTYTETGRRVDDFAIDVDPPDYISHAWTATNADGTYAGSSCDDWKSNACGPAATAVIGNAAVAETWMSDFARKCAYRARLYCISQ